MHPGDSCSNINEKNDGFPSQTFVRPLYTRSRKNRDECTRFYFWKNDLFTEDASWAKFRRQRRDAHPNANYQISDSEISNQQQVRETYF